MRVYLGNKSVLLPQPAVADGEEKPAPIRLAHLDGNPLIVDTPPDHSLLEVLTNIRDLWPYHSDHHPDWVAAENPMVAEALSQQFGGATVRDYGEAENHYHEASGHKTDAPDMAPPSEA